MIAAAKVLVLTFAVMGIAVTGATGAVVSPMQKAIQIHEDHLGTNSTMPAKAIQGQQNSYDRLLMNQDRWLAGNHTMDDDEVSTEAIMLG